MDIHIPQSLPCDGHNCMDERCEDGRKGTDVPTLLRSFYDIDGYVLGMTIGTSSLSLTPCRCTGVPHVEVVL